MIDTVVMTLPQDKFNVICFDKFNPNAGGLFREPFIPFAGLPYVKCVQNMSKEDEENNVYKPRLTLFKRVGKNFPISLHIEFSAPKLLYGNNFDELDDSDFEQMIKILHDKLFKMGIQVNEENLKNADIKTIHYSKNIVFDDYMTVSIILDYLSKIKLNQRLDLNQTDYWNEGHLVRYHAKSYSLVFYDKIADLNKSKDRAVEKEDRSFNYQMDIFEALRKKNPFEAFRIELRLNGRQTLKTHFAKYKISNDFTFQNLFKKEIAQKVLLHYWDIIFEELMPILLQDVTFFQQFELLAKQKPNYRPQKILTMLALSKLIEEKGYRKTKDRFKKFYTIETFNRTYKDLRELSYRILNKAEPFKKIANDLQEFKSLKMKEFDYFQTN